MGVLLLSSLLVCWIVSHGFDTHAVVMPATVLGSLLAWLFVGSGFISFYLARTKPGTVFHRIFWGSVLGRLTVMVVVLLLIFKYTALEHLPFLVSLFCWYFIFQMWEVISFNRLATGESINA
jgi:hypothetical protein